ncbi:hypothetical protein BHM03_00048830 [Ensete ventricosum]|uniref:Uncharacterized protein n=1 Tax=Ensete ventricosum TaxID=4639 RepID=A0A445MLB7_ENSVE|nr:hypothetical protein BHM03_00048830 [Ensete ventricosum]
MVRRLDPRRCSAAREAVLLEACGIGEGSHVGGSGARSSAGKERTSPSRVDPSVKKSTRVTREWVGECEVLKVRMQSEMAEALRCVGRGHTRRDRSPSLSHMNLNAMEMSLGGDMVQRIMVE